MHHPRTWIALALLFLMAACAIAPADDAALKAVFEQVRAGDVQAVASRLSASAQGPDRAAQLQAVHDLIPHAAPSKVQTLTWGKTSTTAGGTLQALHRYDYPDKVLLVETVLHTAPGVTAPTIDRFFIRVLTLQEAAGAEFSLVGKSPVHYAVLGLLAFSLALMLAAIAATIFAKDFKLKWLWCLVSLVTAGGFTLNWNTGAHAFLYTIGLINAGVLREADPTSPWIVHAGLPVGAMLVFLLLTPRRRAT